MLKSNPRRDKSLEILESPALFTNVTSSAEWAMKTFSILEPVLQTSLCVLDKWDILKMLKRPGLPCDVEAKMLG